MEVHAPEGSVHKWKDAVVIADEARKQILASLSAARVQKDVARQLSGRYKKVLESPE